MVAVRVILHLILLSLLLVGAASAAPLTGEAQHVIIVMKEQAPASAGPAELAAFADQSQGDVIATLDKMGAADVTPLWSVNAVAATLSPEEVQKIAARSDVAMVVPDRIVTIDADTPSEKGERGINFYKPAGETIDYINPPPMDSEDIAWGVDWIEAPEVWENGFNGTGVTVAVVDTGIYADHPDLAGKVVGWDDLVNYLTEPYDDYGHGTHCAGTIAGTGASGTKTGVAPGARLIGIKVFDSNGRANSSTVIRGFERAVELGADVISYSGGIPIEFYGDEDYQAIDASGLEIEIPVENWNDGFDPGFICLEVEAPLYSALNVTLETPGGTVYQGVDCDWWTTPVPDYVGMVKYIGDEPLEPGNWTLRIENPSLNASDHVWWSGSDDHLYSTLTREFNLTGVESATFQITSWYDIEEGWDNGYVEVCNPQTGEWDTLLTFTGMGQGVSTADLTPYCGGVIELRLRYETDYSVAWYGWYVDEMAIPAIGYYDDAEDEGEWIPYGWSRIPEEYPVYLSVTTCYADNGTSLQSQAVNRIVDLNGTVVVTSAGNDGDYGLRTIGAPAAAEKAIAVGAIDESIDYIAAYSSRGPVGWGENQRIKPDLVAPGSYVVSTYNNGGYATMSGTSMACPHVSGVVALMLDVNSSLTPAEIRSVLQRTAIDLGRTGPDTDYGAGRVSAWAAVDNITPLQPPVYDQPGLYAGCAYTVLKIGVENNITAIAWDDGPVAGEEIWFRVTNSTATVLNTTVMTDENGLAIASFVPVGGVYISYQYNVSDTHGNVVSADIYTYDGYRSPLKAFDTPDKEYRVPVNATATVSYTLVNPATMAPYTGDVVMQIGSYSRRFTPVNGTISADITREMLGEDRYGSPVYLYPADNMSEEAEVGAGWIDFIDYAETVTEVAPYMISAKPGGNATFVVKMYESLGGAPVADSTHSVSVVWLREAEVKSLAAQFPEETARLRGGEAGGFSPEFMEEISNLQESMEQVTFTTTNGIGKLSIPVPEDAYVGMVVQEVQEVQEYGSGYYETVAIILVNLDPFMHHASVPEATHDRWLSIGGSWNSTYNETTKRFDPGDAIDVDCYLEDGDTGAPLAGTVYLYTSDGCTVVTTGTDGHGSATIPVAARFPGDVEYYDQVQVVGLSGDAYGSTSLSPGGPIVLLSGEYVGGSLVASSTVTNADGEIVPMPGIFEVNRQMGWMHHYYSTGATTLASQYTTGGGSYAGAVTYGSYAITHYMKELASQGSWTWISIYTAATPLSIVTPPEQYYDTPGSKSIEVRMENGEAGIPVYLAWEIYPIYGGGSIYGHSGGASIQETDANGRATLTLNVPENAEVYWEIGGGTPDLVFTTRSGYSLQMTAPHVKGDFNGNGRVDIGDVARVAWMALGLTDVNMEADFNGDGKVDAADAAKIAYYYVGKITSL